MRLRSRTEFRLPDGSFTMDRTTAMACPRRMPAEDREAARPIIGALLRLAPAASGAATPARLEWVRRMAAAGLLPSVVADSVVAGGRLGDREWEILRPLVDHVPLEIVENSYWTLRLDDGPGLVTPSTNGEALGGGGPEPPDGRVLAIIRALSCSGWKLDSVTGPESCEEDEDTGLEWCEEDEDWGLTADRTYVFRREAALPRAHV